MTNEGDTSTAGSLMWHFVGLNLKEPWDSHVGQKVILGFA